MRIGVPREIKDHEFRVGLTPAGARALVAAGHEVRVQTAAGERIGLPDQAYRDAVRPWSPMRPPPTTPTS
jgi:alanine dehydrogenase